MAAWAAGVARDERGILDQTGRPEQVRIAAFGVFLERCVQKECGCGILDPDHVNR